MRATTYQAANATANRPPLGVVSQKSEAGVNVSRQLLYYWIWQLSVAAVLLVAIEFLRRVTGSFHEYNREQFHVVRWCIGASLCGGLLITIYARRLMWRRGLRSTLMGDAILSLAPLAPALLAHSFTDGSLRIAHGFNLGVGIFLFAKCAVLMFFLCQNAVPQRDTRQSCYIFMATFIVLATFARWYSVSEPPEADESHYTLLTYSLIHDHDFDLTNNYAHQDYVEQFPPAMPPAWISITVLYAIPRHPHVVTTFRGERLLWHDVGLPILLVPGYALAKRLGAEITIAVIASLLPVALVDIALLLGAGVVPSVIAAILFIMTPPAFLFSYTIFTEILVATGIAWIVLLFLKYREDSANSRLLLAGILFALLPWVNIRSWVLEFPLFLVIATYLLWQWRGRWSQLGSRLLILGSPIVISLAIFAWFDHTHFNTYLPNAGYRMLQTTMPQFWNEPYHGLLGLFFDRNDGLAPTAPLYVAGFAGLLLVMRRDRWAAAALLLPCLGYIAFLSFSQYWWGGWKPGGRYLLCTIVLLVPAAALLRIRHSWWFLAPLAIWSLAVDLIFISDPHRRWPASYAQSGLGYYLQHTPHLRGHMYIVLKVFPNLMKPTMQDYLVGTCWLVASLLIAWWLAATSSRERHSLRNV